MLPGALILEQPVGGGDNVLDFRTGLRFQKWQRIDEHPLVGDQLGSLLEFGQGSTGGTTLLEYRARFYLCGRRQEAGGAGRCMAGLGANWSW